MNSHRTAKKQMSESEPTIIKSAANPTVRRLVRMRDNRTRRRSGRFIVDGWRETQRAIQTNHELLGLYITEHDAADDDSSDPFAAEIQSVISHADDAGLIQLVSSSIMQKISYGQSSRGVVAEFTQPNHAIGELRLPSSPLILILDRIEKPGNIGAVFRCADAAGIDAVILCDCGSDLYNPNAIRSSLGTVFSVPVAVDSVSPIADYLIENQIRIVAARVESSDELWQTDLSGPLAIVLGNEAQGLGERWQTLADNAIAGVRIPMSGHVDSLNISVSAAVIAFEAKRTRGL